MVLVDSEIITRLVLAAILGALIGIEREIRRKPAGLRTHALICMGAALFTIVSGNFEADPARIAAGIVTGIGFLAAGVIFRFENKVHGITTAPEIWALAAVGIAVGAGMYLAAVATTIIVLLLLVPGLALEKDGEQLEKKRKR